MLKAQIESSQIHRRDFFSSLLRAENSTECTQSFGSSGLELMTRNRSGLIHGVNRRCQAGRMHTRSRCLFQGCRMVLKQECDSVVKNKILVSFTYLITFHSLLVLIKICENSSLTLLKTNCFTYIYSSIYLVNGYVSELGKNSVTTYNKNNGYQRAPSY